MDEEGIGPRGTSDPLRRWANRHVTTGTSADRLDARDRDAGTVGFTTSLGFGRKLERIRRNPQVALAFHAREHGRSRRADYVLVQGTVSEVLRPDEAFLRQESGRSRSERPDRGSGAAGGGAAGGGSWGQGFYGQ